MGEAKRRLDQAEMMASHWALVAKLLAYKLSKNDLSSVVDGKVLVRPEDIKAYHREWPKGEMHCLVLNDGTISLELMGEKQAKAITHANQQAANEGPYLGSKQ